MVFPVRRGGETDLPARTHAFLLAFPHIDEQDALARLEVIYLVLGFELRVVDRLGDEVAQRDRHAV